LEQSVTSANDPSAISSSIEEKSTENNLQDQSSEDIPGDEILSTSAIGNNQGGEQPTNSPLQDQNAVNSAANSVTSLTDKNGIPQTAATTIQANQGKFMQYIAIFTAPFNNLKAQVLHLLAQSPLLVLL